MRLLGELAHGVYNPEHIHPETIEQYCTTRGQGTHNDLAQQISEDQQHQIRHNPVDVPDHQSAFSSQASENIFKQAIQDNNVSGIVPKGLGVAEEEWEDGHYPGAELIQVARKDIQIILPFEIWWLRAVRWVRALELATRIQVYCGEEIV